MENIIQTVNDVLDSPLWGLAWKLLWLSIAVLWLSLVFWTLKDARKRIEDVLIVGVAVATSLVFPFIGTLVYAILRPPEYLEDVRERELEIVAMEQALDQMKSCPQCREPVREGFVVCPKCKKELRNTCASCGRPVELDWRICPYCAHDGGQAAGRVDEDSAAADAART